MPLVTMYNVRKMKEKAFNQKCAFKLLNGCIAVHSVALMRCCGAGGWSYRAMGLKEFLWNLRRWRFGDDGHPAACVAACRRTPRTLSQLSEPGSKCCSSSTSGVRQPLSRRRINKSINHLSIFSFFFSLTETLQIDRGPMWQDLAHSPSLCRGNKPPVTQRPTVVLAGKPAFSPGFKHSTHSRGPRNLLKPAWYLRVVRSVR